MSSFWFWLDSPFPSPHFAETIHSNSSEFYAVKNLKTCFLSSKTLISSSIVQVTQSSHLNFLVISNISVELWLMLSPIASIQIHKSAKHRPCPPPFLLLPTNGMCTLASPHPFLLNPPGLHLSGMNVLKYSMGSSDPILPGWREHHHIEHDLLCQCWVSHLDYRH